MVRVGDGVALVHGLRGVMLSELVEFPGGVPGLALSLDEEQVGCVIFGDYHRIREGDTVRRTGRIVSVPVGRELVGRVISPVGRPLDGQGALSVAEHRVVERVAPGVIERAPVARPLQTGIKAVDALVPIGRGQRQLILGDRQTGKTTLALDAILNQRGTGVYCVYVAIGQKASTVARVVRQLRGEGALDHTVVVSTTASDPAALLFIAPFAGTAVAEYLMEQGHDVLIVYDDLSRHAVAYREVTLLLGRPPGREAFPGDIFYLHSRLLERAAQMNADHGGGSITALPIVETQQGDISAFIPTNIISITDGQIFLETDLFFAGVRPAVNVGLSVSRVGGAAQTKAIRKVAGQLRLDLARYRELAAFARFGADVDKRTRARLDRGERLVELLKQPPHRTLSVDRMAVSLYAGVKGYLDTLPVRLVDRFERDLHRLLEHEHPETAARIRETGELSAADEAVLESMLKKLAGEAEHGDPA